MIELNWLNSWEGGIVAAGAGAVALAALATLSKRATRGLWFYKAGLALRRMGMGFDLPVLSGATEETFKERALTFISDAARLFARGLAGKPAEE